MSPERASRNGKIQIQGIIFDYGNVLCYPQQPSDVEAMAKVCEIPTAQFQDSYWKHRLDYDRGDLMGESYWTTVAREAGRSVTPAQVEQLVTLDAAGWAHENLDTIRWIEQLHSAGIPIALLSNMPYELSRILKSGGTWARFFKQCIFSCDLRRNKPDPAIYKACLKALEVPAEQVLFFDDIPANVIAASALGIHGLVFDTLEKTQARVAEKFDVPVPATSAPASLS